VLFVLFATAALVATIFKRFNIEAIPGYLVAGALVGPHALGLISGQDSVEQVSALAIVLLMFSIGMHLDLDSIRKGLVHILGVGLTSTLVFVLLFWGVLLGLGVARPQALLLALGAGISSTAVLTRTLIARRELHTLHGRITLGVSIVQDLASIGMMLLIPAIALWAGVTPGQGEGAATLSTGLTPGMEKALRGLLALAGVFLLLIAGRVVLPRILQYVATQRSQELVLVASAALALASAIWTSFIGLSAEMGAFVAGLLLAGTQFRFQLAGQLAPLRDLLMAMFFTVVGLKVDPRSILENAAPIAIGLGAVIVLKAVIIAMTSWLAGVSARSSIISGLYLANAGEFTLVVLSAGSEVLTPGQTGAAIAVVMLSLIVTPLLVSPSHRWASRTTHWPLSPWVRSSVLRETPITIEARPPDAQAQVAPPASANGDAAPSAPDAWPEEVRMGDATPVRRPRRVIIAGFGPVGRTLADRFEVQRVRTTIIELNPSTVKRQYTLGRTVVYGDATNREVLEQAGIHDADAIILTIPDDEATMRACQLARELNPHIFIAARASFLSGKFTAMTLGADSVTVEEVATATAMEREVLDALSRWLAKRDG
jgi:CPA2 family monovalent cation:H+ antiporter-2